MADPRLQGATTRRSTETLPDLLAFLNSGLEYYFKLTDRMQRAGDRLNGGVPRGVAAEGDRVEPAGLLGVLRERCERLQELNNSFSHELDRFERLTSEEKSEVKVYASAER